MSEKDVAAFWRMYLQTEEIISSGEIILGKDVLSFGNQEYWKGYLHALKDVGVEVLRISKSRFEEGLTFDFKMAMTRLLREKYPCEEIGFVCGAAYYTVAEIDALEGLRNLF